MRLISKIYKKLTLLNSRKASNLIKKWSKDHYTFFQEEHKNQQVYEKLININQQRNATPTTSVRNYLSPIKMSIIRKSKSNTCWKEWEKRTCANVDWYTY